VKSFAVRGAEAFRRLGLARGLQVGLRTWHIVAMAFALGGLASHGTPHDVHAAMAQSAWSGVLLLWAMIAWGSLEITQGAGWAVLLKLALIGTGSVVPALRLELYVAATVVASIGSHMPRAWRHLSMSALAGAEPQESGAQTGADPAAAGPSPRETRGAGLVAAASGRSVASPLKAGQSSQDRAGEREDGL
jgi:hypothetical protein